MTRASTTVKKQLGCGCGKARERGKKIMAADKGWIRTTPGGWTDGPPQLPKHPKPGAYVAG